jgi:hypothetical protein
MNNKRKMKKKIETGLQADRICTGEQEVQREGLMQR